MTLLDINLKDTYISSIYLRQILIFTVAFLHPKQNPCFRIKIQQNRTINEEYMPIFVKRNHYIEIMLYKM